MKTKQITSRPISLVTAILIAATLSSCSTMQSVFATKPEERNSAPITNPFGDYDPALRQEGHSGTIVRSKRGDRSVEVEFPESGSSIGNVVLPMSQSFPTDPSAQAVETGYADRKPVMADREITSSFPKMNAENESDRRAIETTLGVMASENETPRHDSSYLASMDRVKALFKSGRYEAALIEVDEMLKVYPTNPKLYEMRGTLFDRLGNTELAFRSWNQSLKLEPSNEGLKRFVDRKKQIRGLAGGSGK